jgi:hypothetical protein
MGQPKCRSGPNIEVGLKIAADFLDRWPSLNKVQRARPATIERFFMTTTVVIPAHQGTGRSCMLR